jgi:hypothetical protein
LRFPLLADFEPKGGIARAYGVYDSVEGTSERALFVIDGAGTIRWSYVAPPEINPGAEGILDALEELSQKTGATLMAQARLRVPVGPDDPQSGRSWPRYFSIRMEKKTYDRQGSERKL